MNLREKFVSTFGGTPDGRWVAPGRVNLIGEHTDYNDGFVLPLALPQGAVATAARRADGLLRMASRQAEGRVEIAVADLEPGKVEGWAAYVAGVRVVAARGRPRRRRARHPRSTATCPLGAGLSSSAALECATALAAVDLLRPRRRADRRSPGWPSGPRTTSSGMPCGIMDQSAALLCTRDHALFLDTRTLGDRAGAARPGRGRPGAARGRHQGATPAGRRRVRRAPAYVRARRPRRSASPPCGTSTRPPPGRTPLDEAATTRWRDAASATSSPRTPGCWRR